MFKKVIFSMVVASVFLTVLPSHSYARGDGGNGGGGGAGGGGGDSGDVHDRSEHDPSGGRQNQKDQQDQNDEQTSPMVVSLCNFKIPGTALELCLDSRL